MKRALVIATSTIAGLLILGTTLVVAQPGGGRSRGEGQRLAGANGAEMAWDAGLAMEGPRGGFAGHDGQGWGNREGNGPNGPQGPDGPDGPLAQAMKALFPFWQSADVAQELALTDEQIAALETSYDLTKTQLEETKGSIAQAGKALREEMQKSEPDAATINELIDELTAATNQKTKIVIGHIVVVKNVLTDEQEENVRKAVREFMHDYADDLRELRREVRDVLRNGGSLDDALNVIDSYELPPPLDEIARERVTQAVEQFVNRPGQNDGEPVNFREKRGAPAGAAATREGRRSR